MTPRISPAEPPYSSEIQAALDRIMPPGVPPLVLFRTIARNPRVFSRFMAGGLLDKGSITLKEREIVIDRATARCGSQYEWAVHVAIFAERAELSPAHIKAIVHGKADDPVWSPRESLIVQLVYALHEKADVADDLWHKLKAEFADEQLIELVVLTGLYHMVSFVTNALRLPLEPNTPHFPAKN